MANLHLVTGYSGQPHVSASDQGSLFEAFIRSGEFVLEAGAKFAASIVTNNQIRVNDGEMLMQGRHVKLNPGAYVDLTIENGSQGYRRSDLVVIRYTRNPDSGIEECNLVVLKGTPAESNPPDPEYTTGNLNAEGALQHDFPLYRVSLSGLVLEGLTVLFKPEKSLFDYVNKNFAPSGFGLGTEPADAGGDANNATRTGWYQVQGANTPSAGIWWDIFVVSSLGANTAGAYSVKQFAFDRYSSHSANGSCFLFRSKAGGGEWSPWEWVNPPMGIGVEYRTIERYQDAAVYKKLDSNGNILWRKDGETQWHMLASASYVAAATVE